VPYQPGQNTSGRSSIADKDYVFAFPPQRDTHYADAVEREVLAKGGRSLLIAGDSRLLRGLTADNYPKLLNAASLLTHAHLGSLFMIDPLILLPGAQKDPVMRRTFAEVVGVSPPSLAHLADTWLGAEPHIPSRAVTVGLGVGAGSFSAGTCRAAWCRDHDLPNRRSRNALAGPSAAMVR
jgi:hypothetical protein